jgi:hypothetical protein
MFLKLPFNRAAGIRHRGRLCLAFVAVLGVLIVVTAPGGSAHIDDSLSIAGVITIGQPLTVPECRSSPPVGAADFGGGSVCVSTDKELGDQFKTVWFRNQPPPVGFLMRAAVDNGIVTGFSFETLGAKDQADVLAQLKAKYGRPAVLERRLLQNAFGVQVTSYYAEWYTRTVYVQFDGVTDTIDRGWVQIETAADHAAQLKARERFARERPKL